MPLVKHTSYKKILDTPLDAFSLNLLPINIPSVINRMDMTIDIKAPNIILVLKLNPKIQAKIKNNIF